MVKVKECDVANCAYNRNKTCNALAITVGDSSHPMCDTFMPGGNKGGIGDVQGGVGACKVSSCRYNRSLQCAASGINVGYHEEHAECNTFAQR